MADKVRYEKYMAGKTDKVGCGCYMHERLAKKVR